MSALQRRIYGAILGLHPTAFRNQFSREMMLDFDDALEQRGFTPLIGDAFLSLARQWKERALAGPEWEQPVPSHPFLAGQYFMVDQGRLSAFTLARASLLSAMLLLTIGYSAGIPNRRIIANLQTVQVNHDGGIVSEGDNRAHTVSTAGRREAPGADALLTVPGYGGSPFHGILRLRQEAAPLGKGTRASGGPPVRPVSLAEALRQLTMISIIVWITSFLLRQSPGIARRVVLAALGLLGIAASVAFGQVATRAQSPTLLNSVVDAPIDAVPPNINFDVVSFKRCPPDKFGTTKVDMPMTADYLAYHCESLSRIISFAYRGSVKVYSLESSYPKWVDDDRYEFIVKVAPEDFAAWQKLDLTARRLVIRKVLADTVKLKIRVDNSPKAIYALTAMKKVHLTTYKDGDQTKLPDGRVQDGRRHDQIGPAGYFQAFTMADLAEILSNNMDRVVADHTNLTDRYTFVLLFGGGNIEPDAPISPGENASTLEDGLEQLGLKLEPAKGPVERLVIDHIEKPEED